MPRVTDLPIIPCSLSPERRALIARYADALRNIAPSIAPPGVDETEFWNSGLFASAIERLRGQNAASMTEKREFISSILSHLRERGLVTDWTATGAADRHDYEVRTPDGLITAIEAKGCLDGNNTGIFQRPPNADRFLLWSLCQNAGADPRHNAWSGIHTRLSAELVSRRQQVDGLIIWDMLCGTIGRPCPKVRRGGLRATRVGGRDLPPPCIYVFPRTIPDPRNNPAPPCWALDQVPFLRIVHEVFGGAPGEVTEVRIVASMADTEVCRSTALVRDGKEIIRSAAAPIRRATA